MNHKPFIILLLFIYFNSAGQKIPRNNIIIDEPEKRQEQERAMLVDPVSQNIPFEELEKARVLMKSTMGTLSQIPGIDWKERGPNNVGGRTRALLFDPNDLTRKKVWAGGVDGGLWYNNDITISTSSWQKVNDFWDNMAISCIASDPSNTNVLYVGTGEGWFNGDAVNGGGIWKSANGGASWKRLSSTIPVYSGATGINFAFQTVQKIVVNSSGTVFAATRGGVWISADGGSSWNLAVGLPSGSNFNSYVSDLEIGTDNVVYAGFGLFTNTACAVYKTNNATNDGTLWANITPAELTGGRTEIALAPSTSGAAQTLFMTNQAYGSYYIGSMKRSNDAGTTWIDVTIPTGGGTTTDITNGQAWYDLILAVNPIDPNILFIGGATHARSINANAAVGTPVVWTAASYGSPVHPDNHAFIYRPGFPNEGLIGNDGGVYYSSNFGDIAATSINYAVRNKDYNVSQFYSGAMKNISGDGYLLGGLQDNNSVKITGAYNLIGSSTSILGGDGMLAFIDQDNPGYQFATTQFNNYYLFDANGAYIKSLDPKYDGNFVNPADYDSPNNTLYSFEATYKTSTDPAPAVFQTDIAHYHLSGVSTHTYNYLSMPSSIPVSFLKVGKVARTLFVGTKDGYVYKLSNIIEVDGNNPTQTTVLSPSQVGNVSGNISCIEIGGSDDTLLVTKSNYNVKSVFYSVDGGLNWISKDEGTYGLPNIPVRYALINPLNSKQVLLATELGVWSTNDIRATNPQWAPTNANMAHVRCDMLKFRTSDNTVLLATHGRGLFTTQLNQTNPCQTVMVLIAPYDNKTSGTHIYDKTEKIQATTQLGGTANITYKASKSIELNPLSPSDGSAGFKIDASSGGVFYAYITGCNN